MDLTQIRYFLTLAKTLNFTRAADLCHVTQPALTKSIKRLEIELGGPLLLRERAHTQLTELGAALLPLLQDTFDAAETARTNAQHFHRRDREHLRLGMGMGVEPSVATPLLQELRQRFTQLELTLRYGESADLNRWLLDSEVDVVLTMHPSGLTERANRWPVFTDTVVALMPPATVADETLDAASLLAGPVIGGFDETARHIEGRYALTHAVRHRGATEEQVHVLVRAGCGIGLSTARRRTPSDIVRPAVTPLHAMEVCLAAIAGRPLCRAADTFLRLARARDWEDEAA